MALPDLERLAHHEAGHALVQHRVSRGRYRVSRVSLDTDGGRVAGSSLIDQEVSLGLYEFGLVTLAGIAAENRYFREHTPPDDDLWGAVGDVEEWLGAAREALQSEARVDMVSKNLLRRLDEFFSEVRVWGAVCELAGVLRREGAVEGEKLQRILDHSCSDD